MAPGQISLWLFKGSRSSCFWALFSLNVSGREFQEEVRPGVGIGPSHSLLGDLEPVASPLWPQFTQYVKYSHWAIWGLRILLSGAGRKV